MTVNPQTEMDMMQQKKHGRETAWNTCRPMRSALELVLDKSLEKNMMPCSD